MARSLRLFSRHRRHRSTGALAVILPRMVMVGLLALTLYYLLHKTHQHLNKL
jgi:hypothetical protein